MALGATEGMVGVGVEVVVFDLGNVIVEFDHRTVSHRLSQSSPRLEGEIFEVLFRSELSEDYGSGRVSSLEFYRRCRDRLQLEVDFEEFRAVWSDIFSLNREVAEYVDELGARVRLFLLSNTNEMHYDHISRHFGVAGLFDEVLLSYQLGVRKPDPRIWQEALRRAGVSASACAYVDDIEEYVEVARELGLRGVHFRGAEALRRELEGLGVRATGCGDA
jgi:putative hydrolase of the HAD superfamily